MTTSTSKTRWVYLGDLTSNAPVLRLLENDVVPEFDELSDYEHVVQHIYPAQIRGAGQIGLRRYILESDGVNIWRETGEQLPMTPALLRVLEKHYHAPNGWNYDFPHLAYESSVTEDERLALKAKLEQMFAKHPYEFEIVGLQPRMLMYFSDGNYKSQQKFIDLVPAPRHQSPYAEDGSFLSKFVCGWSSEDRDAGKPIPVELYDQRPLLYRGPAFVVRFLVDGQITAFEGCRVYVRPDGSFICSDWCQRHDFTSYKNGINLQEGIYDFDAWIAGPCVSRALQQGVFKPKAGAVRIDAVRDIIRRSGPPTHVPTLEEALAAAQKIVGTQAADAASALRARVQRSFADEPELDADTRLAKLISDVTLAHAELRGADLIGVPFIGSPGVTYLGNGIGNVKGDRGQKLADGSYRLVAQPHSCGVEVKPTRVCFRSDNSMYHAHIDLSFIKLDEAELTLMLTRLIEQVADSYKVVPTVDPGPITAEALAEARAIASAAEEVRLATERDALLQANLAKATQMTVDPSPSPFASIQPMLAEYDGPFGTATIRRLSDELVEVRWTSGPYIKEEPAWVKRENGQILFVRNAKSIKEPGKFKAVGTESAMALAVNWYFDSFLPQQLAAQKAASNAGTEFTFHQQSFRAYPVVSGTTLERVVDGAVAEAVTVRKKRNGHLYRVTETGETELLKDATVKAAAAHFLDHLYVPQDRTHLIAL